MRIILGLCRGYIGVEGIDSKGLPPVWDESGCKRANSADPSSSRPK